MGILIQLFVDCQAFEDGKLRDRRETDDPKFNGVSWTGMKEKWRPVA